MNPKAKTVADIHQAGAYKSVKSVAVNSGKVVCMAASNTPMSPIVLVATTGRIIHAIDFYTGQKVMDIETKHDRSLHTIIANYGGIYTPRTVSTLDLALSGGFDECFKMWDLRSGQCERTFAVGSRTIRVGCCFSPDSKFVALGTERQGFEVWDVSQGKCLVKLKDDLRGIMVTWLDWNPANGKIYIYIYIVVRRMALLKFLYDHELICNFGKRNSENRIIGVNFESVVQRIANITQNKRKRLV